jgi:hypothetical protein
VNAERALPPLTSADTDVLMDSDGEGASANTATDGSGVSAAAAARAVVTQEQLDAVNVQVCILQHIFIVHLYACTCTAPQQCDVCIHPCTNDCTQAAQTWRRCSTCTHCCERICSL